MRAFMWLEGRTDSDTCIICMDKFTTGCKYKKLPCKHEYHADCLNQWLENSKKCPVCGQEIC